ncbi:hypothetical protein GAY28_00255 [Azospirillum brasilense]|nr:hypothetical protein [Azospirillum brasilense]
MSQQAKLFGVTPEAAYQIFLQISEGKNITSVSKDTGVDLQAILELIRFSFIFLINITQMKTVAGYEPDAVHPKQFDAWINEWPNLEQTCKSIF